MLVKDVLLAEGYHVFSVDAMYYSCYIPIERYRGIFSRWIRQKGKPVIWYENGSVYFLKFLEA